MDSKKHFILFDFDGVIVDSFVQAFEVNKMMCPHITEDLYRKRFEGNINDWKEPINIHVEECRHDIDFFTEYIPRMEKEVRVVPGMEEVISQLEKDYTLIVVSSTITSPIRKFLESRNMASHFVEIMGNDVHTSKVEKIKMVFSKYNIVADDCVFITDTLGDMKESSKLNVGTIGVTWGFNKSGTLLQGNPFRLAEKPKDLLVAISDYFTKKIPTSFHKDSHSQRGIEAD